MDKLPEDLLWDFAKTLMIEDNSTVVNPFEIEDPWAYEFPQHQDIFLFGNPQAEMSSQEFMKHRLNAKRLSIIKRFDSPQWFLIKTSYESQLETDAILLQVLQLKRSLNLSESTRAELEKDQKVSKRRILNFSEKTIIEQALEDEHNPRLQSLLVGVISRTLKVPILPIIKARLTSQFHPLSQYPSWLSHDDEDWELSFYSNRRFIFHSSNVFTYQWTWHSFESRCR